MEETMIQAISKNISQLIIEHSKSTIEAELLLEVEVSIHETIVHMYKEIYVALIVLDSFLANVLEHYPLIVDETVFDTFMKIANRASECGDSKAQCYTQQAFELWTLLESGVCVCVCADV
jgi:hypothetical protein